MKESRLCKLVTIFFFICVFSTGNAFGRSNVIKVNPGIFTGIAYERGFGNFFGLLARPTFGLGLISGFGITIEPRFYISQKKDNLQGFFVGIPLGFQFLDFMPTLDLVSSNHSVSDASVSFFNPGVIIGGQWIAGGGFTFEIYFGLGGAFLLDYPDELNESGPSIVKGFIDKYYGIPWPIGGLGLGYAF